MLKSRLAEPFGRDPSERSHEQRAPTPHSESRLETAPANRNGQKATEKQVKAIIVRARKANIKLATIKAEHSGRALEQLTKREASELISQLEDDR